MFPIFRGNGKFRYDYQGTDNLLDYLDISYRFGGQSFHFAWTDYLMN